MSHRTEHTTMPQATTRSSSVLAGELFALLQVRMSTQPADRLVIGIAGESGSGKTSTATSLAHVCNAEGLQTAVLNLDNYFLLPPRTNHEQRNESLRHVGPHEVNLTLLASHIAAFRHGVSVIAPLVDYPANQFVTQRFDFAHTQLLIVEGTYALALADLDWRIFHLATHEHSEERRRRRNRDIDAPIITQILAIEHTLVAPYAAAADVLVDSHFRVVS